MKRRVLLINGPNLNLLGQREPDTYGHRQLEDVVAAVHELAVELDVELVDYQSNYEGALVERVQAAAAAGVDAAIINPGAYTHTSIALRDAFLGTGLAFIEVHLSNVHARESFRHRSYLSDIAQGVIVGLGELGYQLALRALVEGWRASSASPKDGSSS